MSEEMLSVEEIQHKYSTDGVHLLLPNVHLEQITPFYKLSVVNVEADLSPNSGDVYRIGTIPKKDADGNDVKSGDKTVFEPVYSPAKPLLMKIATAAGIQFDPEHTIVSIEGRYLYTGKACGAIRLPDGSFRTLADIKVIDLSPEEDKQKLLLMDKALAGLMGTDAWNASKLYKGKWEKRIIDNEDKKVYIIDSEERQRYIDRQLLINMIQLRKDAPQKALTGAMLRVVRALIGMKGQYSESELKKPFVLARVNFSPDYSDPTVKKVMFEQGIASSYNLFGGKGVPSSHFLNDEPIEAGFEPVEEPDIFSTASQTSDPVPPAANEPISQPKQPSKPAQPVRTATAPPVPVPPVLGETAAKSAKVASGGSRQESKKTSAKQNSQPQNAAAAGNTCSKCGKTNLSPAVVNYSMRTFHKVLCFNCGKAEERCHAEGNVA